MPISYALSMCFAGVVRTKIEDAGPTNLYPLHELQGTTFTDTIAARNATLSGVTLGEPGLLPEYGPSVLFDGVNDYAQVTNHASLNPSTSFAVGFMIKLTAVPSATQTIWRKENGGAGGRLAVQLVFSAPNVILRASANIGGVAQTLDYTIPTPSDWVTNPRMIFARYDATNLQLIELSSSGVKTTLATSALAGAVASGTPSDIYFGSNAASSEWFSGRLQWLSYWVDTYPTDAELTDFNTSLVWTDVSGDVVLAEGVEAQWGISGDAQTSRAASTGTLQFMLNNSTTNSGAKLGYYSPDHANVRTGFTWGIPVRLAITDPASPSTPYYKFVGRLVSIEPEPGQFRRRFTHCSAADYMDELARSKLPAIALVSNEASTTVLRRLLDGIPTKPHDVETGGSATTFTYGLDTSEDERDVGMQEIARIANSELGAIFLRGNTTTAGVLTMVTRDERVLDTTPDWTLSNTLHELEVSRQRDEIITRAQVTVHPRVIDAAATTVLFTLDVQNVKPSIQAGYSITMRAPYRDPTTADGSRVGGTAMVTPVATTDYTANAAADGSGADMTANLTIAVTFGANSAVLTLTNTHATNTLYVTKLQLRGKGVYTYNPVVGEAQDVTLRKKFGDVVLTLDQPYRDDSSKGYETAQILLNAWSQQRTVARSLTLRVSSKSPTAILTAAIAADVGDLVSLTETVSGISAKKYFINSVKMSLRPGPAIETTWTLAIPDYVAWILGQAGYSEMGQTTYLGFS